MQSNVRTLIVDDESLNRKELIYLLKQFSFIEIIGEADSGEDCVMQTMKKKPDLIFLDVEMPGMDGIETATSLAELKNAPLIVFATAYPEFAVQAFRLDAVDYLLKPYDENDLAQTVKRIKKRFLGDSSDDSETINKLGIDYRDGVIYLEPNDILYIFSEEKQVKIVTNTGDYQTKKTLKDLESRLGSYPFFRTHKSYLVNLNHVVQLIPWFNGAYNLKLKNREEPLPVSRNYIKQLRERLEL